MKPRWSEALPHVRPSVSCFHSKISNYLLRRHVHPFPSRCGRRCPCAWSYASPIRLANSVLPVPPLGCTSCTPCVQMLRTTMLHIRHLLFARLVDWAVQNPSRRHYFAMLDVINGASQLLSSFPPVLIPLVMHWPTRGSSLLGSCPLFRYLMDLPCQTGRKTRRRSPTSPSASRRQALKRHGEVKHCPSNAPARLSTKPTARCG